jgi:hypothetical protein
MFSCSRRTRSAIAANAIRCSSLARSWMARASSGALPAARRTVAPSARPTRSERERDECPVCLERFETRTVVDARLPRIRETVGRRRAALVVSVRGEGSRPCTGYECAHRCCVTCVERMDRENLRTCPLCRAARIAIRAEPLAIPHVFGVFANGVLAVMRWLRMGEHETERADDRANATDAPASIT